MTRNITKNEFDAALSAVKNILESSVEISDLESNIPPADDISDSNKVLRGKLSILFVDIRKSSELTEDIKAKNMVKVYRSFIRTAIQSIRYCGGVTRQFAGDGIMGVFLDDETEQGSNKAIQAARYLTTMIDFCLNPTLKESLPEALIGCGIGITTGTILITKVGMRGKEADDTAENETSIVWTGEATNIASRLCGLAQAREIFIDEATFKDANEKDAWIQIERTKGTAIYKGYVASEYYLPLADDLTAISVKPDNSEATTVSFVQQLFSESKTEILSLVDEISKKSSELAIALENVKKREQQVSSREAQVKQKEGTLYTWESRLEDKEESVDSKERENKKDEYNLYRGIFSNTFCKDALIIQLGKDYWVSLIQKMLHLGCEIGLTATQVKADLAYYLVYIYCDFKMYNEAYDTLCIQTEHTASISKYKLEEIVKATGRWSALKGILEERIKDSSAQDYTEALATLKRLGY